VESNTSPIGGGMSNWSNCRKKTELRCKENGWRKRRQACSTGQQNSARPRRACNLSWPVTLGWTGPYAGGKSALGWTRRFRHGSDPLHPKPCPPPFEITALGQSQREQHNRVPTHVFPPDHGFSTRPRVSTRTRVSTQLRVSDHVCPPDYTSTPHWDRCTLPKNRLASHLGPRAWYLGGATRIPWRRLLLQTPFLVCPRMPWTIRSECEQRTRACSA
jgi:hypothetical protein